ncbi:MAG: hypothetical protein KAW17_01880 [Candidatus Eisenbacteria sp.]|nr:hypothetical protein [Candidatus Eisenbacteria bacterium]
MTTRERALLGMMLCLVYCLACAAPANCQDADRAGFAVSMSSQGLSGLPGQTIRSELTIMAPGTQSVSRCEISALDLGMRRGGGAMAVPKGDGARSCAGWVSIQDYVEVPPDGTMDVPFSISIPAGAQGQYFGYLQVKRLADRPDERIVILVQPVLSVRIEVNIPGTMKMELKAEDLSYDPYLVNEGPGLLLKVANKGQGKSFLEGDILLYRSQRSFPIRAQLPITAAGNPVMLYPGLSAEVKCPLLENPTPGVYTVHVRLLMGARWRTQSKFDITIPKPRPGAVATGGLLDRSEFDLDFRVEPPYLEAVLPTGGTRTLTLRVQNRDTVAVDVRASVVDVHQETNGFLTFTEVADPDKQWASVSPETARLNPHASMSFLVTVTKPEWTAGTFGMCAVRVAGAAGVDEAGYLSEVEMGIPVIAVPPSAKTPQLRIESLDMTRPQATSNPTAAVLVLENVGGRVASITGSIIVEREHDQRRIQTMQFGRRGDFILPPGGTREFRMPMPLLDKGIFRLAARAEVAGMGGKSAVSDDLIFECFMGREQ